MKEDIRMVLAALGIGALIWSLAVIGSALEDMPGTLDGIEIPSERWKWENPAWYGLPAESEAYNGLFY